jgi:hypothetical protein
MKFKIQNFIKFSERMAAVNKNQKCGRCKQALTYFTFVLWQGPNGYRRYALCDKCKREVESGEGAPGKPSTYTEGLRKVIQSNREREKELIEQVVAKAQAAGSIGGGSLEKTERMQSHTLKVRRVG